MKGKTALVTGAASGIGLATARAFLQRGAMVIGADLHRGELDAEASFARCDVSSPEEVDALFDSIGQLDYAVNNAGVEGGRGNAAEYDIADWNRVLAVNLTGVFLCQRRELSLMIARGSGAIVNVASIFGMRGARNAPAYVASKHGVIGLTRAAALEVAARGIRVNAVCPGYIETPMVMERGMAAGSNPDKMQLILAKQPQRRLGKPEEVAESIVWLCSDAASLVNGDALVVDGGLTSRA